MRPLGQAFFNRDTTAVARDLLGCLLVHQQGPDKLVGRIVETEAYDGFEDKASHASKKKTPRNEVMYGPPGHSYVYLIYGMHHCFNLVTREEDYPAAVLIRALEPICGINISTQGPGRLCRAMGIDRTHNRMDITKPPLFVAARDKDQPIIESSPRIGVGYSGEWVLTPWRFFVLGNKWVSKIRR